MGDRGGKVAHGSKVIRAAPERAREGRVHEDQRGRVLVSKRAGDCRAVMAGDRGAGENVGEASAAGLIEFVDLQLGDARKLAYEETVPGARLKDDIARLSIGEHDGDRGKIYGRRELLPVELFLATDGLGREAVHQRNRPVDVLAREGCVGGGAEAQCQRVFENLEAVALGPAAACVIAAIGAGHRCVHHRARDGGAIVDENAECAGGKLCGRAPLCGRFEQVCHGGLLGSTCLITDKPTLPLPLPSIEASGPLPSQRNLRAVPCAGSSALRGRGHRWP